MKGIFSRSLFILVLLMAFGCADNDDINVGCQLSLNLDVDQDQLARDIVIIDAFLEENGITAEVDPSGLRYVIGEPGEGAIAGLCDQVFVSYEGTLLSDGRRFDGSEDPIGFVLARLIVGWQIGIPIVQPGGSITLYIPSVYAYGESGINGTIIGSNANLVFTINLAAVN